MQQVWLNTEPFQATYECFDPRIESLVIKGDPIRPRSDWRYDMTLNLDQISC